MSIYSLLGILHSQLLKLLMRYQNKVYLLIISLAGSIDIQSNYI